MSTTDAPEGDGGTPHWQVAIIGAGAGGLGLAISLVESGRRDFVLFEATDGVGGTWRVNTYPGAACDVPSHLYSYPSPSSRTGPRRTPSSPRSCGTSRSVPSAGTSAPTCAPGCVSPRRTGTPGHDAGGCSTTRAATTRPTCGQCHRHVHHALVSRYRGPRIRRPAFPLGALGARARPGGPAGRRHRNRRELGPDRARVGQGRCAGRRLPTHATVDPAPRRQAVQRRGQAALRYQPRGHGEAP